MESKSGVLFIYNEVKNFYDKSNKWLKSIYNEDGSTKTIEQLKEENNYDRY